MPTLTYIQNDGTTHQVEVAIGQSIMQGAVAHGVPGIPADCGGGCSCATCHVYVDEARFEQLTAADEMEQAMLENVEGLRINSRLACQVTVTEALDGLQVEIPETQGW